MSRRTSLSAASLGGVWPSLHHPLHSMFVNHHLNIEAQLEDLISSQCRDPDKLEFERMNFPTKVDLARAMAGPQPDDDLWAMVLKFNQTRNSFSHRTKTPPSQSLAELRALVTKALPSAHVTDDTQVMISALKICTWFILDIKQSLPLPPP